MDSLAIAGLSMQMQAASLQQAVGMSVMKMQLNATKDSAQALLGIMSATQTMEKSVTPHLGSNLDVVA